MPPQTYKDAAIQLMLAVGVIGQTKAQGATKINDKVKQKTMYCVRF